jgi:hypothetical protein
MILFHHIPVTLERKISELVNRVKAVYGSDFYNVNGNYWRGDDITTQSLFPSWILKEAEDDPDNVTIVQIIKSYLRWVFSTEYGYGGCIDWETMQVPLKIKQKLLEGVTDAYFPGEDFSSGSDLNDLLPNIRKFSINVDVNYFNVKGTMPAIKYLLVTLLGLSQDTTAVYTGSPGIIIVIANVPEKYKAFLNRSVYPAGMTIIYQSP